MRHDSTYIVNINAEYRSFLVFVNHGFIRTEA